jgi:hypothetical protein
MESAFILFPLQVKQTITFTITLIHFTVLTQQIPFSAADKDFGTTSSSSSSSSSWKASHQGKPYHNYHAFVALQFISMRYRRNCLMSKPIYGTNKRRDGVERERGERFCSRFVLVLLLFTFNCFTLTPN